MTPPQLEHMPQWHLLQKHHKQIGQIPMRELFAQDPKRFEHFSLIHQGILVDFSKNRITQHTLNLLLDLAQASGLTTSKKALFSGEKINTTENNPVLHTALRNRKNTPVYVDGENIMPQINQTLERMKLFSEQIRSNHSIQTVVNIGIGGSHLGPEMILHALQPYTKKDLNVRFISNIDGSCFQEGVKDLNPDTTLFVICSKTFTTQETMINAHTARQWLLSGGVQNNKLATHFAAVTTNPSKAVEFGIHADQIFPFWNWVGGRYSWCSAIGLCVVLSIGYTSFVSLLEGAHSMDQHFFNAPLQQNIPTLLAMIGIWNIHFLKAKTLAILPYDHSLSRFPAFLQQLDMESNGKRVNKEGHIISHATGPIVWGEPGTNSQHSFFQLLHQGTHCVPSDFIGCITPHHPLDNHHQILMANFIAQTEALMVGKTQNEAQKELERDGLSKEQIATLLPHRLFPGNQPSNTLLIPTLTPHTLGVLIALYEMKVFVQGVVWRTNSFDQWGVELGKTLAKQVFNVSQAMLNGDESALNKHDVSTQGLMRYYVAGHKR